MEITFNMSTFDIGGKDAVAGDKKLNGEEVDIARKAGWDVHENYSIIKDGLPGKIESKKDDSFFKFTDSKGNFSFNETGKTVFRCLCIPLMLINDFFEEGARRREELENAKFRNAWDLPY